MSFDTDTDTADIFSKIRLQNVFRIALGTKNILKITFLSSGFRGTVKYDNGFELSKAFGSGDYASIHVMNPWFLLEFPLEKTFTGIS